MISSVKYFLISTYHLMMIQWATIYNYNLSSDNPKLTIKKINICTQYRNLIRIQSTLLHELRHVVTSLNNSLIDLGNDEIYSRMG